MPVEMIRVQFDFEYLNAENFQNKQFTYFPTLQIHCFVGIRAQGKDFSSRPSEPREERKYLFSDGVFSHSLASWPNSCLAFPSIAVVSFQMRFSSFLSFSAVLTTLAASIPSPPAFSTDLVPGANQQSWDVAKNIPCTKLSDIATVVYTQAVKLELHLSLLKSGI